MRNLIGYRSPASGSLRRLGLAVLATIALTPFAKAALIDVTFNGQFFDVGFGATGAIPVGTNYTATLQYDSDNATGPVNFTPSPGDFFDAHVGALDLHGTPISYQIPASGQDFFVTASLPAGSIPGLTDPVTMTFSIVLVSGFFFDPNHLPTTFVGLPPVPDREFSINGSGPGEDARASALNITATQTPEPGTLLSLAGLSAIGLLLRKRSALKPPRG